MFAGVPPDGAAFLLGDGGGGGDGIERVGIGA